MDDVVIIPGILEKGLQSIIGHLKTFENFVDTIQIDLADGIFVANKTFLDVNKINSLNTPLNIELHLMVSKPELFIPKTNGCVKKIILHVESDTFSRELIEELLQRDLEVGVALNPETDILDIEPFLDYIQSVQFMTIHPGFQGQKFLPEVLEKIKLFKKGFGEIPIEVDGGIKPNTARLCIEAGATLLVCGSYLLACDNILECISSLKGDS